MKLPQTTGFVTQAGGEVSLAADDPENQALAAMCVIRHARDISDASMLHEMLGLGPAPAGRCPDCGNPAALAGHETTCGTESALRIMRIAGMVRS
jgi:hypothetical protein